MPRVSVRNSVRKPIRPRAGRQTSIRTQPRAVVDERLGAALPQREELRHHAEVFLGHVDRDTLDRLVEAPPTRRVTTWGLPTVSSNPSRRICSTRMAS